MNQLQAVQLEPGALYSAPSGRLCHLCPREEFRPTASFATLVYAKRDGQPSQSAFGDGFTLARGNWFVLRRVG